MRAGPKEPFWRRYLRLIRPDVQADIDEELGFHLEMRAREYEAEGLAPDAARTAARTRFGNLDTVGRWLHRHDRRRARATNRRETVDIVLQSLRYGFRSLRKQPAFFLAAILTLALGIGATTAIFGVVRGVLLKPLPYPEADRLVGLWHTSPVGGGPYRLSHATYLTYRRVNRTFAEVAAYQESAVNISDAGSAERVPADYVTASLVAVLGVKPLLGRSFTEADEQPGHSPVTIIGEGLWRRRFGGAPSVLDQTLPIDGVAHRIIGVLPASVRFPRDESQLWLPLVFDPADPVPIGYQYGGVGRLRPTATLLAAEADLGAAVRRLPDFFPSAAPGFAMKQWVEVVKPHVVLHPLRDDVVGDIGRVLWIIFGTIGFVLLGASANIATLCLVRADARQREFAVHAALGARPSDLLVRFLAESLILAVLGAGLGIAIAAQALAWLRHVTTVPIPRLAEVGLDGTVLLVAVLVSLIVALLTSALPMLRVGRRDLTGTLRSAGRGSSQGRERRRIQQSLVVTQVALAFMLLTACALMGRSFVELRRARLGFDPARSVTFRIALPNAAYPGRADVMAFYERIRLRFEALPGVETAGVTSWLPLQREGRNENTVIPEGDASPRQEATVPRPLAMVSGRYFASLGIPLRAGRTFRDLPPDQKSDEVIVSARFAAQVWGDSTGQTVLGRRLRIMATESAPWLTVVGVATDVRQVAIDQALPPTVYAPLNTSGFDTGRPIVLREAAIVLRTSGEPTGLGIPLRRELAAIDPTLPLAELEPMSALVRRSMARTSFIAVLLAVAAAVALALGAIGLYGVVAYVAAIRNREIGVRIALGAQPESVTRLLARQGAMLAVTGIGIGLVGGLVVTRILTTFLYGVSPADPVTLIGAALLLAVVAITASWIPARRAARIDPATVLGGD